jgi:uncharacterized protein (TIGR03435 family)
MIRTILVLGVAAGAAWGQSTPSFEVASIKQHVFAGGGGRLGMSISGSRVTVSIMTLSRLIALAYDVKTYQVSGGPSWAGDSATTFDIEAKAEGTPTTDQAHVMLRSLLADRFQLKLRRETKDLPVYDLVIAKNGPKMKESAADAQGSQSMRGTPAGPRRMTYTKMTMERFVSGLANDAGRPVIDKTGLTGNYDFTLEYTPDGTPQGNQADAANGPSIFTALEEQLGLKLEPSKAPTEILVIDHAEKPSEN